VRASDPVVDNVDPALRTTDTLGGREPTAAVDPEHPDDVVVAAFSGGWGAGSANAPLWHSTDGGHTWAKRFSVPPPPGRNSRGCPCDQSVDFARGGRLFGSFLLTGTGTDDAAGGNGQIVTGATADPASSPAWRWPGVPADLTGSHQADADRPFVLTSPDPLHPVADRVYVAYFNAERHEARVAVADAATGSGFDDPVVGTTLPEQGNPELSLAGDSTSGAVFAIWRTTQTEFVPVPGMAGQTVSVLKTSVHVTSTLDGGRSWKGPTIDIGPFLETDTDFGGVNRRAGDIAAAVDPSDGDVYVVHAVLGADVIGARVPIGQTSVTFGDRLYIRRYVRGRTGTLILAPGYPKAVSGSRDASLASVAVDANGSLGVLYDTYEGPHLPDGRATFTVHLALSSDKGSTSDDRELETFTSPVGAPATSQPVLGDYQRLEAHDYQMFGAFAGNRNRFMGGVGPSVIDPIFFSATFPTDTAPTTAVAPPHPAPVAATTSIPRSTISSTEPATAPGVSRTPVGLGYRNSEVHVSHGKKGPLPMTGLAAIVIVAIGALVADMGALLTLVRPHERRLH